MNICDCCYEQSSNLKICNYGHKICSNCNYRINNHVCIYCSPLSYQINRNDVNSNNRVIHNYQPEFLFMYKTVFAFYFILISILCLYIDGLAWIIGDLILKIIFYNNEIVINSISYFLPSIAQCIYGLLIKSFLFITYAFYYTRNNTDFLMDYVMAD